ncbi:MAG: hypothetical protein IT581_11180 [Verrucomicrobiales bacterium]|nr:hypothetical protein [Verrucomicrobiales bacterium]
MTIPLPILILALTSASWVRADEVLYETSFEAPAFSPGLPIRGQDQWEMYRDGEAISVSTNNAFTGQQCLRIDGARLEQTSPNSATAYCFSRALEVAADNPQPVVEITTRVRLDGPISGSRGTRDEDILSANLIAVVLGPSGDGESLGGFFVSSAGKIWNSSRVAEDSYKFSRDYLPGTYRTLALRVDFLARQLSWRIDNEEIGRGSFPAAMSADRLYGAYLQMFGAADPIDTPELVYRPSDYVAYFDDYRIAVPAVGQVNVILQFASTNILADEFLSAVPVRITRRGDLEAAFRVRIDTADLSARAGTDYEAISSWIAFNPGDTEKTVSIRLSNNALAEPDRSFVVRLNNVPPGSTAPKPEATVIIRDDERPGSSIPSGYSSLGVSLRPKQIVVVTGVESEEGGKLSVDYAVYVDPQASRVVGTGTAVLNVDGSLFKSIPGPEYAPGWTPGPVYRAPDGKRYPLEYDPLTGRYRLTQRLNPDRSKDPGFASSLLATLSLALTPLPNGKVLAFSGHADGRLTLNDQRSPSLIRLGNDGLLDGTFQGPTNLLCGQIVPGIDGRLMILSVADLSPLKFREPRVQRLNADGSIDLGFATFSGPATETEVRIEDVRSDGSVLVQLIEYSRAETRELQLNPDGAVDAGFPQINLLGSDPRSGPSSMQTLSLPAGKSLRFGRFKFLNGREQNSIATLNADRSVDETFRSGLGFWSPGSKHEGSVSQVFPLGDGRMLVEGYFDRYNQEKVTSPVLLRSDGTLDRHFSMVPLQVYWDVDASSTPALFGVGDRVFYSDGLGLGELRTTLPLRLLGPPKLDNAGYRIQSNALDGESYTLQSSDDLQLWRDFATQVAVTNQIEFQEVAAATDAGRFYRVRGN